MNLTSDRTALSAAASTVDDVTCTANYRQLTKPGQGCVRMAGMTRSSDGFGFMVTWQVLICLPQPLDHAEEWVSGHVADLIDALADEMVITLIQNVELVLGTGRVPALIVEGARAA